MRKSFLPSASQPWGADIERLLQQIEKRLGTLESSTSSTRDSLAQVMPTIGRVNVVAEAATEAADNAQTAIVMANDAESTADGAVTWSEHDPLNPPGTEDNPVFPPANPNALWYTVDGDGTVVKTWQWEPSDMDPDDPAYVAGSWVQQQWGETALAPGSVSANILADAVNNNINKAKEDAATAIDTATAAGLAANHAQSTADGKNTVYYQDTAPTGSNLQANDVWYDTSDGYKMYRYSGTEWVAAALGTSALSDDINDSINMAISDSTTAKQVSEQAAIDASSAVVLRVDSTRGLVFKNSLISTILTVTVFGKGRTITNIIDLHDAFGPGAYLEWSWRRIDDTDFGIISSADSRLSEGGFKLTVSPEDVDIKTVFMCSLNV